MAYNIFIEYGSGGKNGISSASPFRDTEDANRVVYLFALKDLDSALAFTETPEARKAGELSGVIGEVEMLILNDEI